MKLNSSSTLPVASSGRTAPRGLLAGADTVAAAALAPSANADTNGPRRTFVLVHGAWHGGWCWRKVADRLEAQGHKVYTPTLTGLADRSHLLSMSINPDTHINDIVNLFLWEDIKDAVLVAHSYGGWPVSGALEKLQGRVSSVVFVDAFLPENGQRVIDLSAPEFQQVLLDAIASGNPGRTPPKAEQFKVMRPEDVAWVDSKMTPQPTGVSLTPIALTGARDRVAKKMYIRATGFANATFDRYLAAAKANRSWTAVELPADVAGHDVMVDAPQLLTELLIAAS